MMCMDADEMKRRSRGQSVDMSPEAIAKRIDLVSQLRALSLALKRAGDEARARGTLDTQQPQSPPAHEQTAADE